MVVRGIIKHVHLYPGQNITIYDVTNRNNKVKYFTSDRCKFEWEYETFTYLMDLKVNSFRCDDSGIEIYAEERKQKHLT